MTASSRLRTRFAIIVIAACSVASSDSFRADSPTGPVVARIENIPNTGSTSLSARVYRTLSAGAITDPGGVHAAQDSEFVSKYCDRVPLGRMAEPEDLSAPLVFLASDDSRYVTGHELRVDGGFTA